MAKLPLVSIIIPIYNVKDYVAVSLKSALDQTYPNVEIILVNDCTPDESMKVVEELLSSYNYSHKSVKIINLEKNQGLSQARNIGINNSCGEFIYFLDSDDYISKDCVAIHVSAVIKYNTNFSDANIRNNGSSRDYFHKYAKLKIEEGLDVQKSYFKKFHITACNKLLNRKFIVSNNLYFQKGMLYEDMIWCYKLLSSSVNYITIPEITYFYNIHPGSTTTENTNINHIIHQFKSFLLLMDLMSNEFNKENDKSIKRLQNRWYAKMVFRIKGRLLNAKIPLKEKIIISNRLEEYVDKSSGFYKLPISLPYGLFNFIFRVPNYFFRKYH